jgi:hypothetical protein
MVFLRFAFLLLFAMPALADNTGDDAVVEASKISARVEKHFYARQFKAIQALDEELRTSQSKQRLSDGRWSITFLYSQLGVSSYNSKNYDEWLLKLKIANEWIAQTPDQGNPYLARATIELGYAWAIRGSGYSSQISADRMAAFKQQVSRARQTLENPVFEKQKHPLWFYNMLEIAKLQAWDPKSYKTLFDAAVQAYPGYEFLYFQATEYYQPIWLGSKDELKRFVDESVERTREAEGMVMYTRLYWYMLHRLRDKTFDPGNAQWVPMKQGFERMMRDYPSSKWNLNAFGYYACMAKDWGTFKKLQASIGDAPAMAIWNQPSRYYTCIEQATTAAR